MIEPGRRNFSLGRWETERHAALAYDRGALHYFGPSAELNFPEQARRMGPADAVTLKALARAERKKRTSSRYTNVCWDKHARKWIASFVFRKKYHYIGLFEDEVLAAEAYDHAAMKVAGPEARVNFHPVTGEFVGGRKVCELDLQKPKRAKRTAPPTTARATRKRTR